MTQNNKLWKKKSGVNIYGLVRAISKQCKDFTAVSIFKPWVARHVYDKYLPSGGIIVDPCMGWGGRLLGTVDSKFVYKGFDLNPLAVESNKKMAEFIGSRIITPEIAQGDSSLIDFPEGDLLFTSPPYDDCEHYYGIDSTKTKTAPILENIFSKFRGVIALNVPKRQEELCKEIATKCGRTLIDRLEMKTASFMGREKTYEPILVFQKVPV